MRKHSALPAMSPGLVPVLACGIDDAPVSLEELVGHLEDRKDQRAAWAPRDMAAARLAPDELARAAFHVFRRTFLVDQASLEHIALFDVDMLVVRQHRARLEPHQSGHQSRRAVEQQRLGLAAGKAGLLPRHVLGANQVGMRLGSLVSLRCYRVHSDAPLLSFILVRAAAEPIATRSPN